MSNSDFDDKGIVTKTIHYSLIDLANAMVWPHCAEGMGVDGDEVTQRLIDEGRVMFAPDEGFWLTINTEQIKAYVDAAFKANRRGMAL